MKFVLLAPALDNLVSTARNIGISIKDSIMSLDGVYSSAANRKRIFNLRMKPNIRENKRNRKSQNVGESKYLAQEYSKKDSEP